MYLMSQKGNERVACSRVLLRARFTQPLHSLSETSGRFRNNGMEIRLHNKDGMSFIIKVEGAKRERLSVA